MKKFTFLVAVAALPALSQADEPTLKQQLLAKISASSCLAAEFTQVMYDESGQELQNASGKAFAAKPRLMNWSIATPDTQQIITDGTTLWRYEADLEQVIISDLSAMGGGLPLDVLTGEPDSLALYDVTFDDSVYKLRPSDDDSAFTAIEIAFSEGDQIRMVSLQDSFLQQTDITFTHLDESCTDVALYQFQPPEGIDVIYE